MRSNRILIISLLSVLILFASSLGILPQYGFFRFLLSGARLIIILLFVVTQFIYKNKTSGVICKIVSAMMACLFACSIIVPGQEIIDTLLNTMFWPASFLLAYNLTIKNPQKSFLTFKKYFVFIIAVSFYGVLFRTHQMNVGNDELLVQDNNIFALLTVIPWIMLYGKRKYRLILMGLVVLCAFISLKRSAIIIISLSSIIFLFFEYVKNKKNKALYAAAIILGVSAAAFVFENNSRVLKVAERFDSIEEDEGSGRLEIYSLALSEIASSFNIIDYIFGKGHNAVAINHMGLSAHNDFIEVCYDYGIVSFILYCMLHVAIIKRLLYLYKTKSAFFEAYFMSWIVFIVMSWVSHLILYSTYIVSLMFFWAFIEAVIHSRQNCILSFDNSYYTISY